MVYVMGKQCVALLGATMLSTSVLALPVHDRTIAGQVALHQSGTDTLTIHQGTGKVIVEWDSFDIDAGERVNIQQPDRHAIMLNRIKGHNPSQINGALNANGKVWLINPSGMMFGRDAQVNVGGLLATTATIDNQDFLDGRYKFDKSGRPNASITNRGTIRGDHGTVGLLAPNVSNEGTITVHFGTAKLAAAETFTVDFHGDGLLQIELDKTDASAAQSGSYSVSNEGNIFAHAGSIEMSVAEGNAMVERSLNHRWGVIEADSVGTDRQGNIVLGGKAGVKTEIAGVVHARGTDAGEAGGNITVTGDGIAIQAGAALDASGDAQGGTIRVGGEYKGSGTTYRATNVIVEKDTRIDVSATTSGDGGEAIIWADNRTDFFGTIHATGGEQSGHGGFVETSGKNFLNAKGYADLTANDGYQRGLYVLDPLTIEIIADAAGPSGVNQFTVSEVEALSAGADVNLVADNTFTLNMGGETMDITNNRSVTFTSTGDDIVNTSVGTIHTSGTGNITLDAQGNDIILNNGVTLTAQGSGNILLKAADTIRYVGANVTTQGGDITFHADSDASQFGGIFLQTSNVNSNGGDITLGGGVNPATDYAYATSQSNDAGVHFINTMLDAQSGDIILNGHGDTVNNNANGNRASYIRNSTIKASGNGSITVNGRSDGAAGFFFHQGIIAANSTFEATDDATITFNGKGGMGTLGLEGVLLNSTTNVRSENGDILIDAVAGDASIRADRGMRIADTSSISSSGNGNITINATAGNSGNENDALRFTNTNFITASQGDITLNLRRPVTAANSAGINLDASTASQIGNGAMTGNILINSNSALLHDDTKLTINTQGDVIFAPITIGTDVNLDASTNGLALSQTELNTIKSAANVMIGDTTNTANVNISDMVDFSTLASNISLIGDSVALGNSLTTDATKTLSLTADNGSITHTAGTLTANTINLAATSTIAADLIASNIDIGTSANQTRLTGTVAGLQTQAGADLITGGPGNNPNYTFEDFTIRLTAARDSIAPAPPPVPAITAPSPIPEPIAATTPMVPAITSPVTVPDAINVTDPITNNTLNSIALAGQHVFDPSIGELLDTQFDNVADFDPDLSTGLIKSATPSGTTHMNGSKELAVGDSIQTGGHAGVTLCDSSGNGNRNPHDLCDENTTITMGRDSTAQVKRVLYDPDGKTSTYLDIQDGTVSFMSDHETHKDEIKTIIPGLAIKVTGTCFIVDHNAADNFTNIVLFGGGIELFIKGQLLKLKHPIQKIFFAGKDLMTTTSDVAPIKINIHDVYEMFSQSPDIIPSNNQLKKCGVPESDL